MKPRFSILALLGITAFIAVNLAAFLSPLSIWVPVAFWAASFGVMAAWAIVAAQYTTKSAVFARAAVLFSVIYIGCALGRDEDYGAWRMPHNYLVDGYFRVFPDAEAEDEYHGYESRNELARAKSRHLYGMARGTVAIAVGVIGGYLALWRYRVLERRAAKDSQ